MAGKPAKHVVHGEWMTVREAAERLGVKYRTLEEWRTNHRRPDGSRSLLEEAFDWYTAVNAGRIPRRPGKHPRLHRLRGRLVTVREAAEQLHVTYKALYNEMWAGRSLEAVARRIERRRTERAVRTIVGIMAEGTGKRKQGA